MKNKRILIIPILAILLIIASGCGKKEYSITFETSGGSSVISQKVEKDTKVNEPASPTREGYKFIGWYNGSEEWDFDNKITDDIVLIAKWEKIEEITYTVTFDSNGGTNVLPQTVNESEKATEPLAPTKEGYTFVNWTLAEEEYDFSSEVTKNITLVAQWDKTEVEVSKDVPTTTKVTVTFDSAGGTRIGTQTINKGSVISKPKDPVRSGYTFTGWTRNGSLWNFKWTTNVNVKLVAQWKKNEIIPPKPIEDKYTIKVVPVDDYSPELLIYVYKNGTDITAQAYRIMDNDFILAQYSTGANALKANKAQYEQHKNNELTVIINNKTFKITK